MPPLADRIGRKPGAGAVRCCVSACCRSWAAWAQTVTHDGDPARPFGDLLLGDAAGRAGAAVGNDAAELARVLHGDGAGAVLRRQRRRAGVIALAAQHYGWQIGFWLGGAARLPGAAAAAADPGIARLPRHAATPPTRRSRSRSGAMDPRGRSQGGEAFHFGEQRPPARNLGPLAMFSSAISCRPILLWIACFLALGNIALLANWMPTFFQELGGIPIEEFANFGDDLVHRRGDRHADHGLPDGPGESLLADRRRSSWSRRWRSTSLGHVPFTTGAVPRSALIAWNFTQVGGQTGINNLATLAIRPKCAERDRLGRGLGPDRRDRDCAVRRRGRAADGRCRCRRS